MNPAKQTWVNIKLVRLACYIVNDKFTPGDFVVALSIACQHTRPFCLVRDKCGTRIISIP